MAGAGKSERETPDRDGGDASCAPNHPRQFIVCGGVLPKCLRIEGNLTACETRHLPLNVAECFWCKILI